MSVFDNKNAFVDPAVTSIGLAQMFTVTAASTDPTYLVLTALDRNEYTAGATGATGSLSGNGHSLQFSGTGSDGRGAGIVFTYQSGRYFNSTYGYLDQLSYYCSGSLGDVTNLSLFGTSSLSTANAYATDAYAMMQVDASGYLGSATVVTQPKFSGVVPSQATPNSIATVALGFAGQPWNMDGCWVLASTIAADAGASLPVQSTAIGIPGMANGEWFVAFNGPAGQAGNWQALVKAGEIIVIGTPGGGGHITTCVSGSGSTAMLVDNITYENSSGQITNLAHDGSATDIVVASPHPASQEWSSVTAGSVVIYELDTPVVTATVTSASLAAHGSEALGSLFVVADPANKTITQWQVYDTAASDMLVLNGTLYNDHSAASALTATALNLVSLSAGSVATTDTIEVRAYNGTYWGDWQSLPMTITAGSVASPPVLNTQTPNQTWTEGKTVSLALPSNTFTDPRGQPLSYVATQSDGQPLPAWLSFNASTETFSGTAPTTSQSLSIKVTATDSGGLTASESFAAVVQAGTSPITPKAGISVTNPTPKQTWTDGQAVTLVLPSSTFTDALGLKMTFAAYEVSGPNVTSWLHFNPAADELYGTVPATASGTIGLAVVASDAQGMSASDLFSVAFVSGSTHATPSAMGGYGPDAMPAPVTVLGMLSLPS